MSIEKTLKLTFSLLAVISMLMSGSVWAKGDAAKGKEKSVMCQSCHGAVGISPAPQFPTLAGQYESYLIQALEQYRSGERKNTMMTGMAAPLKDDDIADLAAWYASQPGLRKTPIE